MSEQVRVLLLNLEAQLKHLGLWRSHPPDPAALASTMPFCVDTLPLQSWLQFIFLPRIQALLDAGVPLPGNTHMLPIAEEAFKPLGGRAAGLLAVIDAIDHAMRKSNE